MINSLIYLWNDFDFAQKKFVSVFDEGEFRFGLLTKISIVGQIFDKNIDFHLKFELFSQNLLV